MLRFFTTAGLVLALSQAAFAQAPPAPPSSGTTPGHMMSTKSHMMGKGSMSKNKMHKGTMMHKKSMMHGSQMNGTMPKGAAPPHSP